MNYFLDGRINRAEILFPGVACFLIAIFLGAAVHSSNAKDDQHKLSTSGTSFCTPKLLIYFLLSTPNVLISTSIICLQGG